MMQPATAILPIVRNPECPKKLSDSTSIKPSNTPKNRSADDVNNNIPIVIIILDITM